MMMEQNEQSISKGRPLARNGYEVIEGVYSTKEVDMIIELIDANGGTMKFGEREFLKENPLIARVLFNDALLKIIQTIAPGTESCIKSIYFDKPPNANWVVNWHQDLTINLVSKKDIEGYKNWRVNSERVVVQPDRGMLDSIFTIRVHLDNCNSENGALRVIEKSHTKGVIDIKEWVVDKEGKEVVCEVGKGGVLLMKPLVLHASKRTENRKSRRVIHMEFTNRELPQSLEWKEEISIDC